MSSVKSHAEDMDMSVDETMEISPEHSDPCTEDRDDTECESLSQPLENFLADVIYPEEYSQAPASSTQTAFSQQPSPELLMSLGITVRDFAYENTLPAIVPVPRVPRQVQPAPRAPKRLQRDWDNEEGPLNNLSPAQPLSGQTGSKKPRPLERQPTEPLQEPAVQHTRALERITVKRLCSVITSLPRRTLPTTPRMQLSASPPTSPLTPPFSHLASQESEFVQAPSTFPFVVHVGDTSTIPTSQLDLESKPLSHHPVLFTRITLDSHSSPRCSPAPNPPQNASLITPFLELPPSIKESEAESRVRKRRSRGATGMTPPNRYQLRQRPIPSPRASSLTRCSHQASSTTKSLPRRTRRAQ